ARAPSGTLTTSSWRASIRARSRASGPSNASIRTWVDASGRRPSPKTTAGAAREISVASSVMAPDRPSGPNQNAEDRVGDRQEHAAEDRLPAERQDQQDDQEDAVLGEDR